MNSDRDFWMIGGEHLTSDTNLNLYLLLDHAGLPGLRGKLTKSAAQWASLFEDKKEREALCVAPILVRIGGRGRLEILPSLLAWLKEHGTYTSTIIMLASMLPIDSLRRRLAARLEVKLSENMDAMLRFFDPRILEQLVRTLSADQSRSFFCPATIWWYVDRSGQLTSVLSEFKPGEECDAPLTLSAAQEFELIDASEPDQVIALLRKNAPELASKVLMSSQYAFVTEMITAARRIGLSSTADLTLYCALALSKGREYLVSPIWIGILEDVTLGRRSLLDAVTTAEL